MFFAEQGGGEFGKISFWRAGWRRIWENIILKSRVEGNLGKHHFEEQDGGKIVILKSWCEGETQFLKSSVEVRILFLNLNPCISCLTILVLTYSCLTVEFCYFPILKPTFQRSVRQFLKMGLGRTINNKLVFCSSQLFYFHARHIWFEPNGSIRN